MLNMRSGGSPNFCTENWGSCIFWVSQKNNCYYNDIDKRSGELSGPSDLCSIFRSLVVAFGKTFALDLKFDLNQSADQMKVRSLCKPGAFNSYPNHMRSV